MAKASILVVDDRSDVRASASFVLEENGYTTLEAESPAQAKSIVKEENIDLILLDMNFSLDTTSGEEGLSFLSWLQASEYQISTVAMTAWSNLELAIQAMQLGASDFLEKPWKNRRLLQIISQQLKVAGLQNQNIKLKQQLEERGSDVYCWRSPSMQSLFQDIENVATADVAILLTGDNGTGKSQLARHIHSLSHRSNETFVSVNMGAISESLFESEMFGHKKGAFTDAKSNRIGRFELAQNGTLFLDEIANIPLPQQAKLLRVLETGEYEPLGSSRTMNADVRIISASNGNFPKLINDELFREDLFYRLNTIELRVPSLKERGEDIQSLAEFFLIKFSHKYSREARSLSSGAISALKSYAWPGNIRELSHLMERAVLLSKKTELSSEDLSLSTSLGSCVLPMMTLEEAEKTLIQQALRQSERNIPKAAEILGLTRSSLYRRLEKYDDIEKP